MTITAKLALSQIKTNRSRTLGTLLAITLSTALTTAVCSFVVSGNAMLVNLMGDDYGEYGASYTTMLLVPALVFGILILSMSIVVVSNVFRISAGERSAQFGILKCVGATQKQIQSTVMYESVFLSAAGIPAGILLGLLLAYGGTRVANHFLDDLNALVNIMMYEADFTVEFVFSWAALLASAVLCFVTVLFSAWFPARRAARAAAVDSVRGTGTVIMHNRKHRISRLIQRLFGYEGTLAARNMERSRNNFRATITALTAGVILFISLGALSNMASDIEAYMAPGIEQTVTSEYMSAIAENINSDTKREERIVLRPFDSDMGNTILEKLSEFDSTQIYGMGSDNTTYYTILPGNTVSGQMAEALKLPGQQSYELSVEIITLDELHYRALCETAGVLPGSNILLNHYRYNDNGNEVNLIPYTSVPNTISLIKADGSSSEIEVSGAVTQKDLPRELIYPNIKPVRLVVPRALVRGYTWYNAPMDVDGFIKYSDGVLKQMFPQSGNSSYMEEGFNTRVYRIDEYMKVMNIAIVLITVFLYCFVALLMLIGFTSVISTMSTNVQMRSREFAVLQSVGMTPEGLKRMLNLESILCSLKALLAGLPVGILITILINKPVRTLFPIPYQFPWLAVVLSILAVFLITWSTTRYAAHRVKKQNIIETIRSESGR